VGDVYFLPKGVRKNSGAIKNFIILFSKAVNEFGQEV